MKFDGVTKKKKKKLLIITLLTSLDNYKPKMNVKKPDSEGIKVS